MLKPIRITRYPLIIKPIRRAGEPEPGVYGSLEPEQEPLEKQNKEPEPLGAGAGAGKN